MTPFNLAILCVRSDYYLYTFIPFHTQLISYFVGVLLLVVKLLILMYSLSN